MFKPVSSVIGDGSRNFQWRGRKHFLRRKPVVPWCPHTVRYPVSAKIRGAWSGGTLVPTHTVRYPVSAKIRGAWSGGTLVPTHSQVFYLCKNKGCMKLRCLGAHTQVSISAKIRGAWSGGALVHTHSQVSYLCKNKGCMKRWCLDTHT